jgi:hypothetical protein
MSGERKIFDCSGGVGLVGCRYGNFGVGDRLDIRLENRLDVRGVGCEDGENLDYDGRGGLNWVGGGSGRDGGCAGGRDKGAAGISKGEELYMKGMRLLERTKSNRECKKKELEVRNSERLTSKPHVARKSHCSGVGSVFREAGFLKKMLKDQSDRQKLRKSMEDEKLKEECTFHPKTNKISNEIVLHRRMDIGSALAGFEKLYNMSKISGRRQSEHMSKCYSPKSFPYKPILHPTPPT